MLTVQITHKLDTFSIDLQFESGNGLTALFGPSGAGKTTAVNLIAGLAKPDQGRIAIDDTVLVDTARGIFVPKHKRRIGYIFQDARLFPHLTVRQNLLFGRWFAPRGGHTETLEKVVTLLGIGHLFERAPRALSGGEKQRVAIGRALLANPCLLLMDEPLASLDNERKEEILPYIERLRDEFGIPIVFVSHVVAEVGRLATTVVLMANGRVTAVGPVGDVMSRLDVSGMASRFETGAILETRIASHDARFQLTCLECPAGTITVPHTDLAIGTPVRVRIRARDIIVATQRPAGLSALNVLTGEVNAIGPASGPARDVQLNLGGQRVLANLTARSVAELGLTPGRAIFAIIKTVAIDEAARSAGRYEAISP